MKKTVSRKNRIKNERMYRRLADYFRRNPPVTFPDLEPIPDTPVGIIYYKTMP